MVHLRSMRMVVSDVEEREKMSAAAHVRQEVGS